MPGPRRKALGRNLLKAHKAGVDHFLKSLTAAVYRQIERIVVLPLHGKTVELRTVDDAVKFIQDYGDKCGGGPVERYEILIRYNNGDRIEAIFRDKASAIKYLRTYQPLPLNQST